ncbi:glyoxalase/bleomycin resistance/extradiol dioxygenase family protein [Paraburkholderia sp. Ac-20340]|uniref:VOC family protein n=1 Tax=Paraburkholderia sp. Ac-20340 TaxID=2703888 RepID=UPI00197D6502|nr:VOC family protein [Paraburkholderia sp. Ac-20340]MBN3854012.1 glyoxalase/bleomycin resistance/extradiol dioxygenase family protein [Paraburkholderia sp. Ac-20340]
MRVTHVALWTRDLVGAADFWRQYFDAEVGAIYKSARRPGFESCFVQFPGGGAQIELMTAPWVGDKSADECIGWDHIALSLGSKEAVDALAARCDASGLLLSSPRMTGDGFYEAVLVAPDGTRVEITS